MTLLCRRHFEINFNEWKLVILIKLFCSTATHDLGYHMSRSVVTQAGQLRPIWLTLANLTGELQTFFRWKCLNSNWYYIEICFKGVIYNNWALIQLMEPTTVGSLWLENDLHENELEFESHMGRSKKNVRVTSDGIHAEIHEIWTCVAPAAPPLFHAAVNPCLQGESPWNWSCNSVNLRKSTVTWMRRHNLCLYSNFLVIDIFIYRKCV